MKAFFAFLVTTIISLHATSQNIGIGNNSPAHKLDISGRIRIRGGISEFFSAGMWLGGSGQDSSIDKAFIGMATDSTMGFFANGYSWSFVHNFKTGATGIGNSNPSMAGLTVDKKVGAVHALLGSNTTGLSLESDYPGIGFNSYYNNDRKAIYNGYGGYIGVNPALGGMVFSVSANSISANQSMALPVSLSIASNGNVGIGLSAAAFKLDIAGRMRLRAEAANTAGIWFNNTGNTASPAFAGMKTDDQIGFYGSGTGWGFTMNTQTGAMAYGGDAGESGQVLTSNGSSAAPQWKMAPGSLSIAACSGQTVYITDSTVEIPGLVAGFSLSQSATVLFNFRIQINGNICFGCVSKQEASVVLCQMIGAVPVPVSYTKVSVTGFGTEHAISGPIYLTVPPGSYTYKLYLLVEAQTQSFSAGDPGGGGMATDVLTWQIL